MDLKFVGVVNEVKAGDRLKVRHLGALEKLHNRLRARRTSRLLVV